MEKATRGWTLGALARLLDGVLDGPENIWITGPSAADEDQAAGLAFAENQEYLDKANSSKVAAVITFRDAPKSPKPCIRVDYPKQAFGKFLNLCQDAMPLGSGIHPTAVISPLAKVSPSARIGAFVVVESGVIIEDDAKIYPFVFVGSESSVGRGSVIYPHAVLYSNVEIGSESIIHSHSVIGSDGFGFTWNGSRHVKVPHLGKTKIGSNVEIGAGTTIDRAMLGVTSIGDGSKIDNQVQIGHNCIIGEHAVIASQTGVSGSCTIGDRCTLAGQVGVADHVTIGNDVIMTARAAVARDLLEPGAFRGAPALPIGEQLRIEASLRKVPQLLKRVKDLERQMEKMCPKDEA